MAKYRKKPVVIEAVQFDPCGEHRITLPDGVCGYAPLDADNWAYEGCIFSIATLEGGMIVKSGDWIITGVKGEKYPCKPDIFEQIYEKV